MHTTLPTRFPPEATGRRHRPVSAFPKRRAFISSGRMGSATVETALVMLVWMLLLIGTLDLAIVLFRHTFVHHLANSAARMAAVRGANSAPEATPWGPTTVQCTLNQAHPVADALRPLTGSMSPADLQIRLEWPDGGNGFDQRVRVTVTATQPTALAGLLPGPGSISLQATSLGRISN